MTNAQWLNKRVKTPDGEGVVIKLEEYQRTFRVGVQLDDTERFKFTPYYFTKEVTLCS